MRRRGAGAQGRSRIEGRGGSRLTALLVLGLVCAAAPLRLCAQVGIHAQGIPLLTRAWNMPGSEGTKTEFALAQPAVMLEWRSPSTQHAAPGTRFSLHATLDAEGLTIPDGELAPGDYGEGFYDRRHPHTYFHEIMGTAQDLLGAHDGKLELSVAAGKGFVAFGDDDPMSRPVVRYPVDHHLAQILERAVVIGAATYGAIRVEATGFNGDEPLHPSTWPNPRRFFDSRALRLSFERRGFDAQYSYARVKSPEHREGSGPTQKKQDASLRWSGEAGGRASYALVNWARTDEAEGFFVFHSLLVEGSTTFGRHRPYARFERTDRIEDQRTSDPMRSVRPPLDNTALGVSRWSVLSVGDGVSFLTAGGRLEWRPFVEASLAHVSTIEGIFDPESFYGSDLLPSVTVGVRFDWGGMGKMRMGRYFDAGGMDHMMPMSTDGM